MFELPGMIMGAFVLTLITIIAVVVLWRGMEVARTQLTVRQAGRLQETRRGLRRLPGAGERRAGENPQSGRGNPRPAGLGGEAPTRGRLETWVWHAFERAATQGLLPRRNIALRTCEAILTMTTITWMRINVHSFA